MPKTTYHRDGTVTVWDVYAQQWRRVPASGLLAAVTAPNAVLPTLPQAERLRISRHAQRHA